MHLCDCCPRHCNIDREKQNGFCGVGALPHIALAALHMWEEPCISGKHGSGAVFFCGCNMRCVFCQNASISRGLVGETADSKGLAGIMLDLAAQGAHNINLVTATPHIDVLVPAIQEARERGLSIPIVYNTNAYETEDSIDRLAGLVDVYLPDFKYVSPIISGKYSGCTDYAKYAERAILRMYAQVGPLRLDPETGMAVSGLLIRHLVLPGAVPETRRVLRRIAELLPLDTHVSLMGQYVPCYRAAEYSNLNRRLLKREYARAIDYALSLGFSNLMVQSLAASDSAYIPEFDGRLPPESKE